MDEVDKILSKYSIPQSLPKSIDSMLILSEIMTLVGEVNRLREIVAQSNKE